MSLVLFGPILKNSTPLIFNNKQFKIILYFWNICVPIESLSNKYNLNVKYWSKGELVVCKLLELCFYFYSTGIRPAYTIVFCSFVCHSFVSLLFHSQLLLTNTCEWVCFCSSPEQSQLKTLPSLNFNKRIKEMEPVISINQWSLINCSCKREREKKRNCDLFDSNDDK